ncbi:hypothetical protein DYB32_003990 [Aphanomyces invadans]|uniref:Uncharacterized protein n=1 Tax=Aphanomyces invadans TaxID=157072 RepID=A0A418AYZ6_9STRA|nr:hypothetical protein DYB32_003990 [Aphanomyces invadans]
MRRHAGSPSPAFRAPTWRIGNPFTWSVLQAMLFHPLNFVMSTASFAVVVTSICSHLYLYITTALRFRRDDMIDQVDIFLPHCIAKAATTDITIHECFRLQHDTAEDSVLVGVDLCVKQSFFHSAATIELYMATIYFVSVKPLCSSLFLYVGPLSFVAACLKLFDPTPAEVHSVMTTFESWTGREVNMQVARWVVSGEVVVTAIVALIVSELTALISHDLMRVFCCEWKVEFDRDTLAQLLPFAAAKTSGYGTTADPVPLLVPVDVVRR